MYFCSEGKNFLKVCSSMHPFTPCWWLTRTAISFCSHVIIKSHSSIHAWFLFYFNFFVGGRCGFKMEFCNNLTPLRQEKRRRMWFNREKWTKALELQMHTCQSFITLSADIYCDKVTDSKLISRATYIIYLCH